MSQGNLAKNTTFFTAAMAIQKILSFVYFIIVARFIGVENTGRYSFALSFTTIFAIFLDFGLTQILIRETARDRSHSQKYLANVLGLKILCSLAVYVLVVVIINLMNYPLLTRQLVYVSGLVMLLDSFSLSFYGVLRGHQNLRYESLGVILNQFIVLLCGVTVLIMHWGLVPLIGAYLIGSLFNFLYSSSLLKIKFGIFTNFSWDKTIIKKILKLALPFAIAGFFVRLYSSMDMILLSKLSTDRALGLYSVAYKITFALQFIATSFSASLYPAFSQYFVSSKELLAQAFVKAIYYLLVLSMPLAVGLIALADQIIGPVFGRNYAEAVAPLRILLLALVLIFIYFPVGAILNACNYQTRNTINLGVVAIFNMILNLILIPLYGYNGAALAALLSYILLFSLGITVVKKITPYDHKFLWLSLGKIFLSCLAMWLVVSTLKNYWHFAFTAVLGAVVYFAVLYLLKGFGREEISQFANILARKKSL